MEIRGGSELSLGDGVVAVSVQHERERDLLFRAAAETDDASARELCRQALESMNTRRDLYFTGDEAVYAGLDDLFLMMEGVANWAAVEAASKVLGKAAAIRFIRRKGHRWTQDEGLAIFLTIDRLVPGWQARVFSDSPAGFRELLAEAGKNDGSAS